MLVAREITKVENKYHHVISFELENRNYSVLFIMMWSTKPSTVRFDSVHAVSNCDSWTSFVILVS